MEEVLKSCRESQHGHFFMGFLWFAEAKIRGAGGEDARPIFRNAIREYDEALRLRSGDAAILNDRRLTYRCLGEAQDTRGVDPTESFRRAVEDASAAIRLEPEFGESYVNRGYAHLSLGDWQRSRGRDPRDAYGRAIKEFTEALRRNQSLVLARHNRAIVCFRMGETLMAMGQDPREWLKKSISDCEENLRRNPNHVNAYCHRAVTHMVLGDYARFRREDPGPWYGKVLFDCKEAMKRDPDRILAHYYGAIAHRKLAQAAPLWGRDGREEFERAIDGFGEVLKRTQKANMYTELGMTYVLYGDALKARMEDPRESWRNAVKACTEAIRRNPGDGSAHYFHARALTGMGQIEFDRGKDSESAFRKAIEGYRQALRGRPHEHAVYNDLAGAFILLGEALSAKGAEPRMVYGEGIESLEKARNRFPSAVEITVNLGILLEKTGRLEEALRMYEEALRLGGGNSPFLESCLARARKSASKPKWRRDLEWGGSLRSWGDHDGGRERLERGLKAAEKEGAYGEEEFRSILARGHLALAQVLAASSGEGRAGEARGTLAAEAVENLRKALELGWTDLAHIRKEPDLAPLGDLPGFKALMKEWEAKRKKK
jgi:tetratricopeptide (TPR) repeat protein